MRLRILGSGTSLGVPVIGCDCDVCRSADPRNNRTRTSVLIQDQGRTLLIDTSTDFRRQALDADIRRIDAVLYTHDHADHISGLDDLRPFNFRQAEEIPVYGNQATMDNIRRRFSYIFENTQRGGGKPQIIMNNVDGPFVAADFHVTPVPLLHGQLSILGYRIGNFAYCTDVSEIPESSYSLLDGLDVLVIDALRYKPHPTHFSLEEALEAIDRIRPKQAFLTHMTHSFEYTILEGQLPDHIHPAYDGLVIDL